LKEQNKEAINQRGPCLKSESGLERLCADKTGRSFTIQPEDILFLMQE